MANKDYAKWKLRDNENEALVALSQKGYNFKRIRTPNPLEGSANVVRNGLVTSNSGYLAVCELYGLRDYLDSPLQNFMDKLSRQDDLAVPKIVQFNRGVLFRNKFGDGVFGVFSDAQRKFYVESEPRYGAKALSQVALKREEHEEAGLNLEGVVGVGSGIMAIIDPQDCPLSEPVYNKGDYFTILRTGKGNFECAFDKDETWLIVQKKR